MQWATPSAAIRCGGRPETSWPSIRSAPAVGAMTPLIVRASVVLPAPLAPRMAIAWPLCDRQIEALQNTRLAVARADPGKLQRGRPGRLRRGGAMRGARTLRLGLGCADMDGTIGCPRSRASAASVSRVPPVPR